MLYHLASYFYNTPFMTSITFRIFAAMLTSIIFTLIFGKFFITYAKKHFRSKISTRPPDRHQEKNDTPTMGGLLILGILFANTLLLNNLLSKEVWFFLFGVSLFAGIGLLDDWRKIHQKKGISARHKSALQLSSACIIMVLWYYCIMPTSLVPIPLFKTLSFHLGIFIIPWGMLVILATTNAVNLTDGLDGLVTGSLIPTFTLYGIIAYVAGHFYLAQHFGIPFLRTHELSIIAGTLIGALIGFLWFNCYPAHLFMGDVGSLLLGAALALFALMTRQELLLPLAGGIYVIETLSVIMQVGSNKIFGKKPFRMAPIHHHFELLGLHETTITTRFWIVSFLLAALSLMVIRIGYYF